MCSGCALSHKQRNQACQWCRKLIDRIVGVAGPMKAPGMEDKIDFNAPVVLLDADGYSMPSFKSVVEAGYDV
jgi:hypothetical protein